MSIVTIVGSGMMGSALSFPLSDNGHEIRLVGTPLDDEIISFAIKTGEHKTLKRKLPAGIKYYYFSDFKTALKGADVLVGGVSSFGVDWFAKNVLPLVPKDMPVISVTKGMQDDEEGNLVPFPTLYKEKYGFAHHNLNAIGGPCTSYELADHDPTEVCFCGEDVKALKFLKNIFKTDYYNISISTDVVGVETAVAMKNAYALGVTLAVGLSEKIEGIGGTLHYNSQAGLFLQSVKEMRRLLKLTGGNDDNIIYGAGDLYVTVFGGRTRLIGTLLGRGLSFDEAMAQLKGITLESVVIAQRTTRAVKKLIEKGRADKKDYPLLMHIDEIIHGSKVNIPWSDFEEEHI